MPSRCCATLSRRDLRQQFAKQFSTDDIFDGFCLDYFPFAYKQFGGEMSRCRKENILLHMISEADLTAALCKATCHRRQNRTLARVCDKPLKVPVGRAKTSAKVSAEFLTHAVIVAFLPAIKGRSSAKKVNSHGCVESRQPRDLTSLLSVLAEFIRQSQAAPTALRRK